MRKNIVFIQDCFMLKRKVRVSKVTSNVSVAFPGATGDFPGVWKFLASISKIAGHNPRQLDPKGQGGSYQALNIVPEVCLPVFN